MALSAKEWEELYKQAEAKAQEKESLYQALAKQQIANQYKNNNVLEGIAYGAKTGVNQIQSGFESAGLGLQHTVADVLGMDDKASELEIALKRAAQEQAQRQAEINSQYDTDFGGVAKVASDVTSGAVGMLPTVAAFALTPQGKIAAAGKAAQLGARALGFSPLAMQAGGGGINKALNEGADIDEAKKYGAMTAVKEVATELPFAGVAKIPGVVNVGQKIAGGSKIAGGVINAATEGMEEATAEALDPFIQRATYKPNAQNASWDDMLYSALIGAGTAGLINSGFAGASKAANKAFNGKNPLKNARKMGNAVQNAQNGAGQAQGAGMTNTLPTANNRAQNQSYEVEKIRKQMEKEQQALLDEKLALREKIAQLEQAEQEKWEREVRQLEETVNILKSARSNAFNDALFNAMDEYTAPEQNKKLELDLPMAKRTLDNVSNPKVKAYQSTHPEVKAFFREQAEIMLNDLNNMIDGGREYGFDPETRNVTTVRSQSRLTSSQIDKLMKAGMSKAQIKDGLERIIRDNGAENTVNAKKVETTLDDALQNGYQSMQGRVPKNLDYAYHNADIKKMQDAYSKLDTEEAFANAQHPDELINELEYLKERTTERQQLIDAYSELLPNMSVYESMSSEQLHNEMDKLESASRYAPDEIAGEMMKRHRYLEQLEEGRVNEFIENEGMKPHIANAEKQLADKKLELELPRANENVQRVQKQIDEIEAKQASMSAFSNPDGYEMLPTAKKSSTVQYEDFDVSQLPEDVQGFYNMVNEAGKRYGFNLRAVNGIEHDANGMFDGQGNILIDGNKMTDTATISKVIGHEGFHYLKGTGDHKYIIDLAINYLREKTGLSKEQLIQRKIGQYRAGGVELDVNAALDEIGAEFMQEILSDPKLAEQIWSEEPTLAQRIMRWLEDMVNRLTGKAQENPNAEIYRKALDAYSSGLRNMQRQNANYDESRYMLVGTNADGIEVYETSDAIKQLPYSERKKEFLRLMNEEYAGRTARFTVNSETYYARFAEEDLTKNVYGDKRSDNRGWKAKINVGADGGIFDLVENAKYKTSGEETGKTTKAHKDVKDWDYFVKTVQIDNHVFDLLINVRKKPDGEYVYSLQLNENKTKKASLPVANPKGNGVRMGAQRSGNILPQNQQESNTKKRFSLDTSGRQLTAEQADYFKNSKARDENGNLLVMYHGSPNAGFTEFRSGTYFTPMKWYADGYQKQGASMLSHKKTADNPDTYEVYLNIEKPFDTRNPKERRIFEQEYYRQWGTGAPLSDSGLPDWTDGMDLQEFIEEKGYDYDGLILDEGAVGGYGEEVKSRGLSYVVFSPEQVKNVDNQTPTKSADIRYSLPNTDSKGRKLSEKQAEFFAESKMRDEQGNLKVMYHGSQYGGFTVFERRMVDDSRSFFFTDSPVVARSYSHTDEIYKPSKWLHRKLTVDEMTEIVGDSYRRVIYEDGEYKDIKYKSDHIDYNVDFSTPDYDRFFRYLAEEYGMLETPNEVALNYEVYLNIRNPLIVEARGAFWDELPVPEGEVGRMWDTRDYSEYAYDWGYDGVIFKNIRDAGDGSPEANDKASTVAIAFYPEQIKDVGNTRPTGNEDIRFSLPKMPNQKYLAESDENLQAFMYGSQVVNEDGSPKIVYSGHGNTNLFGSAFDKKKATAGGFYFTANPDIASNYAKNKMGVKEYYEDGSEYRIKDEKGKYKLQLRDVRLTDEQAEKFDEWFEESLGWTFDRFVKERGGYDYRYRRLSRRNLADLYWLMSENGYTLPNTVYTREGAISGKSDFEELMDAMGIEWDSYSTNHGGVFPVYLSIRNPIDTSKPFPKDVMKRLERIASRERWMSWDEIDEAHWTADYPVYKWIEDIKEMEETGEETYWATQVPTKARKILQEMGYDGIKDTGGKMGGEEHEVWIAFEPTQVKSAIGNRGTFDPTKKDMRYSLDDLVDEYGALPKGENPYGTNRDIDVPRQTADDNRVSKWAGTAMEAEQVDDITVSMIERDMEAGRFTYEPSGNQEQIDRANGLINHTGWERQLEQFQNKYRSGQAMTADDIVLGERLIQEAQSHGDYKTAVDLIADIAAIGTELGRAVQALSVLKRLTPQGKVQALKRVEERINSGLVEQGKQPVKLPEELLEQMLQAESQQMQSEIWDSCIENMANQVPATLADKINAWRYLAMLSNPKTHIRNMMGNSVMRGVSAVKRGIQTSLENRLLTAGEERYTELNRNVPKEYFDFAEISWQNEGKKRAEASGGRYNDAIGQVERNKRIFNTEWLEKWRKGNENALFGEDMLFKKSAYINALARYMHTNGLAPSELQSVASNASYEKGVAFALNEADKATFQEASKVANLLSRMEHSSPAAKLLMGGALPFKKTPINILKRGVEYSPVGLMNGLYKMRYDVQSGKMTKAEAIDAISAGLTGTGIMVLGYFMASMGMLTAGAGEDDERKQWYDQSMGSQNYALVLPNGGTATIDWLAPSVMPLMAGAELYKQLTSENPANENSSAVTSALEAISKVANPVLEMSMLQGVTDALQSYNSGTTGVLSDLLSSTATSYGGQFIPAPVGALARTVDDTVRSSYAPKDSAFTKTGEKFARQQMNKLPFVSMLNNPSVDVWGNEVERAGGNILGRAFNNFINPSTYSADKKTALDNELDKLYKATGNSGVLPSSGTSYIAESKSNPKIQLSADEYMQYGTTKGQKSHQYVSAFVNSYAYSQLPDEDKAKIVSNLYSLANYQAKKEALNGRGYDYSDSEYDKVLKSKMEPQNYYIVKYEMDMIADKVTTGQKSQQISYLQGLQQSGIITDEQCWYLRRAMIGKFSNAEMAACPYAWIKQL